GDVRLERLRPGRTVRDAEEVQEVRQGTSHDQVLGGILAAVAAPGDEQQARDPVEEVEGAEGVQRHAEPRVLHDDDRQPAPEVGAGRHAERGVLPRLGKVEAPSAENIAMPMNSPCACSGATSGPMRSTRLPPSGATKRRPFGGVSVTTRSKGPPAGASPARKASWNARSTTTATSAPLARSRARIAGSKMMSP